MLAPAGECDLSTLISSDSFSHHSSFWAGELQHGNIFSFPSNIFTKINYNFALRHTVICDVAVLCCVTWSPM